MPVYYFRNAQSVMEVRIKLICGTLFVKHKYMLREWKGEEGRGKGEEINERTRWYTRTRACDFPSWFMKIAYISPRQNRIVTISYFGTRLLVRRRSLDKHVLIYTRAYVSNTRANPHTRIRPVHLRCHLSFPFPRILSFLIGLRGSSSECRNRNARLVVIL